MSLPPRRMRVLSRPTKAKNATSTSSTWISSLSCNSKLVSRRRVRSVMDAETRQLVRTRANHRCEYCGIHQCIYPDFAFHIEHIVARQQGGGDELNNLALSCHLCLGAQLR